MSKPSGSDRREFLRGVGRYALALLLGGGVGAMVARTGERCSVRGPCGNCAAFDGCRLPRALSAQQAMRGRQQ